MEAEHTARIYIVSAIPSASSLFHGDFVLFQGRNAIWSLLCQIFCDFTYCGNDTVNTILDNSINLRLNYVREETSKNSNTKERTLISFK